jgi:hypothetical protein
VTKFYGTLGYAPIAALNGWQQSPVDDLESLGYTLAMLACGDLPWWNDEAVQDVERKMQDETVFCSKLPVVATFILTVRKMAKDAPVLYDTFVDCFRKGPDYVPPPLNTVA